MVIMFNCIVLIIICFVFVCQLKDEKTIIRGNKAILSDRVKAIRTHLAKFVNKFSDKFTNNAKTNDNAWRLISSEMISKGYHTYDAKKCRNQTMNMFREYKFVLTELSTRCELNINCLPY